MNPFTQSGGSSSGGSGLFEINIDGDLMPITDNLADDYYELDADGNIMPIEA